MTEMTNEMTKPRAEKLLNLSGSYTYKELNKAYRKEVLKNHPDAGGTEEAMINVNAAKKYLDSFFADDKNATIICSAVDTASESDVETKTTRTYTARHAKTSEHTYKASDINNSEDNSNFVSGPNPYVNYKYVDPTQASSPENTVRGVPYTTAQKEADAARGFRYNPNTRKYEPYMSEYFEDDPAWQAEFAKYANPDTPNHAKANHRSASATVESGESVEDMMNDVYADVNDKAKHVGSKVSGTYWNRPDDTDAPTWWRVINWMIDHFPWRTSIWVFTIIYAIALTSGLFGGITLEDSSNWMMWLGISILNIFGIITNPIRALLRTVSDMALEAWQRKNGRATVKMD